MIRAVICLLLFFANNCFADWKDWSDSDKGMFVASTVAITADWMTTRYYSKHQSDFPQYYETNPILGKHPTAQSVDLYFAALVVSNYYIADWLPPEFRGFYLGLRTGAHASAAMGNVRIGWKMQF